MFEKKNLLPSHFEVNSKEEVDAVLTYNPVAKDANKKSKFKIQQIKIEKYLSNLLEGDPNLCLFGELVSPIIKRAGSAKNKSEVQEALAGFQYVVPDVKEGPLEGWNGLYNKLSKWLYEVHLHSADLDQELTFVFRSEYILSESELCEYIYARADWNLARELRF